MSAYPRMMYRAGTKTRVWGIDVDTLIVHDAEEQKAAIGEGWTLRPDDEPGKISPLDHDRNGEKGGSEKRGAREKAKGAADADAG